MKQKHVNIVLLRRFKIPVCRQLNNILYIRLGVAHPRCCTYNHMWGLECAYMNKKVGTHHNMLDLKGWSCSGDKTMLVKAMPTAQNDKRFTPFPRMKCSCTQCAAKDSQ